MLLKIAKMVADVLEADMEPSFCGDVWCSHGCGLCIPLGLTRSESLWLVRKILFDDKFACVLVSVFLV